MQKYTVEVDDNGSKFWYQNDKLHRIDGPAIEWAMEEISTGTSKEKNSLKKSFYSKSLPVTVKW